MTIWTFIALVVVLGAFYSFCKIFASVIPGMGGKEKHCLTCGHEGVVKRETRGSLLIEIVLWLCFLVPGLIYSLWRVSTRYEACANCGATNVVPMNSPVVLAKTVRPPVA